MRQHPGVSLFVRPILWTDFHAKVLGVNFNELEPFNTPMPVNEPGSPPTKGHLRPSATITKLTESLSDILLSPGVHPVQVSTAVRTVLSTLWPPTFRTPKFMPEMHLYYGGKVYRDAVRTQLLWNYPSSSSMTSTQNSFRSVSTHPAGSNSLLAPSPTPSALDSPMVCYIGKSQLATIRRNLFRIVPAPGKKFNEPVHRLQQLRSKALVPDDSDQDAHLAGIFLAMAQRHFYPAPIAPAKKKSWRSQFGQLEERLECPVFHDVTLRILTHDTETAEFIVYTGHVTAEFLRRFHFTRKAPHSLGEACVAGLKIDYSRVPIWPILGLRERLGQAFGEDVVGSFDPTAMETWEDDEDAEVSYTSNSNKRKREALSEVTNGSFEEETDGEQDTAGLGTKRQRIQQGPPLGVVA